MAGTRRQRAHLRALAIIALGACATAFAALACNALNGGHDRVLDTGDGSRGVPEASTGGDAEAGVLEIPVSKQFTTLNDATFMTSASGTTITAFDGGVGHAVIVPVPQPTIPSEDYTVIATVLAPMDGEFGVLTRLQPSERAVVFGSKFGNQTQPFLGTFGPPDWSPTDSARGLSYAFTTNARYILKVRATANNIVAKMWDVSTPEPADKDAAALLASPFTMGRGIGFYTYGVNGAVLESMTVTVP